jgi:hypothetical protein
MNIKGVSDIRIISQLVVSKLVKFNGNDIIKKVYNNNTLTNEMKKNIINHIVGKYNKKSNTKVYNNISLDEKEANGIRKNYGGNIIRQKIQREGYDDLNLYINHIENDNDLIDGFRLLSLMIYDTSHKLLLELKEKVEKCGMTVYSCNTDCLYIERDLEKLKLFKRFNPEYFDFTDKNNYDAIGKLKIDFNQQNLMKIFWFFKTILEAIIVQGTKIYQMKKVFNYRNFN